MHPHERGKRSRHTSNVVTQSERASARERERERERGGGEEKTDSHSSFKVNFLPTLQPASSVSASPLPSMKQNKTKTNKQQQQQQQQNSSGQEGVVSKKQD